MQAYPAGFVEALSVSHKTGLIAWIDDAVGKRVYNFPPITEGNIAVDRNAAVRRTLQLSIADYAARDLGYIEATNSEWFTPDGSKGILAPYGNTIVIARGTQIHGYVNPFWGGDLVYHFLGVFRIANPAVSSSSPGEVQITAYDRSRTVSRNAFVAPYVIALGSNTVDAIAALVLDRLDPVVVYVDATPSTDVTPLVVLDTQLDPWQEAQKLATSIGYEVYFGPDGRLVIQPDPTLDENPAPLWTYATGNTSQLLRVDKDTSDEPGYNGVVLTAESQTLAVPLRSEVWDTNPNSPTYAEGSYGRVPKFISSPYISNQAQADVAVLAELQKVMGGTEGVNFSAIVNCALEPGDPVLIQSEVQRLDHVALVDSLALPLQASESMTVTCRRYRSLA